MSATLSSLGQFRWELHWKTAVVPLKPGFLRCTFQCRPSSFMLLGQDLGLSQTSSLSFIDGDVFRAHDGYEFRRRRKLGARGRLIDGEMWDFFC
jgi:hypothetical protein